MNVYVLRSLKDSRLYVGMSANIKRRLLEHNSGKTRSTKGYVPWELLYHETHPDRAAARKRERYLKSGYGKQWLKEKFKSVL